jgi:hypothetical protein
LPLPLELVAHHFLANVERDLNLLQLAKDQMLVSNDQSLQSLIHYELYGNLQQQFGSEECGSFPNVPI